VGPPARGRLAIPRLSASIIVRGGALSLFGLLNRDSAVLGHTQNHVICKDETRDKMESHHHQTGYSRSSLLQALHVPPFDYPALETRLSPTGFNGH
jgi:hypothetical protein